MKYEKPEIARIASALEAIQSNCGGKGQGDLDSNEGCGSTGRTDGSAYEADE